MEVLAGALSIGDVPAANPLSPVSIRHGAHKETLEITNIECSEQTVGRGFEVLRLSRVLSKKVLICSDVRSDTGNGWWWWYVTKYPAVSAGDSALL